MRSPGLAIGAACCLTGCLIPFPIEEEPPETNFPPYAVEGTVFPPPERVREYDPDADDQRVAFDVGFIDDPNAGDVLFYRWFIDFSPSNPSIADQGELTPDARGSVLFDYAPCQRPRPFGVTEAEHRIEVVVSDRPFLDGSSQAVPEQAGVLHLTWFVRLDPSNCN